MSEPLSQRFVSEALAPRGPLVETGSFARGEPPLPSRFGWRDGELIVRAILRTWRSTNTDRGDTYLARHWYALTLDDGREAVIYFDRKARRRRPNWWLYSLLKSGRHGPPMPPGPGLPGPLTNVANESGYVDLPR